MSKSILTSLALFLLAILVNSFISTRETLAATPAQTGSEINWLGGSWNITGVNMAWYNWGCDFGCNQTGGVSQTKDIIGSRLATVTGSGLHTVRWWVFPGDPWQITRDGSGMPTGINPAVYADFDAALELANTYDLYYNFVLFNAATAPPRSWIDNPTHRQALGQVLGTLFDHYKNNPRILSWEIFNEPEFQIWNGEISQDNTVATAKVISDSVHANSDALVTIGHAFADGIPLWSSANLDYYSPHWYDYMNAGTYCLQCNDYDYYKNLFSINKPIVIGEIYLGPDINPQNRLETFYNKGYAGVWGWSLFPEKTNDQMQMDMNALDGFSNNHTDLGPQTPVSSASPSSVTGDISGLFGVPDGVVNIWDYNQMLTDFGSTDPNSISNIEKAGTSANKVDIFDYNLLLTNFGT